MSVKIIPSPDMLDVMADLASEGAKRQEIADAMGVSRTTLAGWIVGNDFPEIKQRYIQAKQVYANDLAENLMAEASAPLHSNPKLANAEVQRRRLIVDTSKWIACKLLPKVYGDHLKIDHEHSGEVVLSPLAQLRQLEAKGPVIDMHEVGTDKGGSPPDPSVTEDDCF